MQRIMGVALEVYSGDCAHHAGPTMELRPEAFSPEHDLFLDFRFIGYSICVL